jgi:biotin carboxylase
MVDEPELTNLAQALVAEAGGWHGPINLEFRRHQSTGHFYLMEANCRLNGYSYLTTMNGINLPRITLDALLGREVQAQILPPPENRRTFVIGYRETVVKDFLAVDAMA